MEQVGTPAISEPTRVMKEPSSIAFMVPGYLEAGDQFQLGDRVTR